MTSTILAGTLTAKLVKASVIVAAVDSTMSLTSFAADISVDPPENVGEFVSTAAEKGLAFSLAVLFVALLITRKIKVVDPDETKALDEMRKIVEESRTKQDAIDHSIDDLTDKVDKLAEAVTLGNLKLEARSSSDN